LISIAEFTYGIDAAI
jgi:hypothetical protein